MDSNAAAASAASVKEYLFTNDLRAKQEEEKLKLIKEQVCQSRLKYLKQKTLVHLLQQQSTEYPVLRQLLSLQRVSDERSSLGIEERIIQTQKASYAMAWKRTRPAILKRVKELVEEDCQKLVMWTKPNISNCDRLKSVPLLINERIAAVQTKKEDIRRLKRDISKKNVELQKVISNNYKQLLSFISDYQLKYLAQETNITTEHLSCKTDALRLKLNVVKLQLLAETYSPNKAKALHEIRCHLDDYKHQLEVRLSETQHSLQHYESLGGKFMSLATEYHKLLEEIENKKWALTELGKTKSNS